ncbi:retrotransposon hot spot (RHS) protein [Trypanosoma cruzi Dm28c]|uniref:Retrotransposon hot spot (RHS) protein n=1 Tax=Trypanosoma cruzi Dm28c TaxID=1416333 RepID=V5AK45_TRYCR|nr:retrotransposon hot spot (RHS) protein [Trypanosoma cruzi Dm28c]
MRGHVCNAHHSHRLFTALAASFFIFFFFGLLLFFAEMHIFLKILRTGGHFVLSHSVDDSLVVVAQSCLCVFFFSFSFSLLILNPFSFVGWCSAFNSIQLRRQGETMPGKRKRVQGDDNTESQASAVPQGDGQTRARLSSDDETDQPAATHIRVAETRQPQWTLDSWLKKVLLEEKERTMEMWLNDFLRNYFDGRGVGECYRNVMMEEFLISPNKFIKDQVLLDTIKASSSYQELKKEREEYYVLLGALNKLSHEYIFTLRHWRDFKKKGYGHSSCKGTNKQSLLSYTESREVEGRRKGKTRTTRTVIYH